MIDFLTDIAAAAWALREWIFFVFGFMFAALWVDADRRFREVLLEASALDVELERVEAERDRLLDLTRVELPIRRRSGIVAGPVIEP